VSTATEIKTIVERTKPRDPGKCHTVDTRGYALCGASGPRLNADGSRDTSHLHAKSECRARGHKHCTVCIELERQLGGGDHRMVA
jgi:hypothetical protein